MTHIDEKHNYLETDYIFLYSNTVNLWTNFNTRLRQIHRNALLAPSTFTPVTLSAGGALVLCLEGFVEADAAEKVTTGRHHRHLWRREALQGFHAHGALRRLQSTPCWGTGKVIGVV